MTRFLRDRRLVGRYSMKTPLRVRLWKSTIPEQVAESVNVSQRGIYFATNSVLHEGETVEVFFQYAGDSAWRAGKRMALHGARGARGSDSGDRRKVGRGSAV